MRLTNTSISLQHGLIREVMQTWKIFLKDELGVMLRFLYPTDDLAAAYPGRYDWETYRIVIHRSGRIVGIDDEDYDNQLALTKADIIKHQFDLNMFRNEMCAGLGLTPDTQEIGYWDRIIPWGTWEPEKGVAFPVSLSLVNFSRDFHARILTFILERQGLGNIVLTPTRSEWEGNIEELARKNKVLLVPLNDILQIENDRITATPEWNEYLIAFCKMVERDLPSTLHQKPLGNLFAKRGEWLLRFSGKEISLNGHLQGPAFVRCLMMKPHQEIHVEQLWKEVFGNGKGSIVKSVTETDEDWNSFLSSGEEVMDATGRAEYQKRLLQLRRDRADAIMDNDAAWLERINQETETISAQLRTIVNEKGRVRMLGNERDKLRLRIRKNITKMIDIISQSHTELAEHFRKFIEMGEYMVYRPSEPIKWLFE
jgi:ElaB/YqjD/DUF883 family membrane-anchored ribosome-binding protein